jgi:type I restriction enzyme M protein
VPVEQVIANGFNLDIKNPNVVPDELGDPVELLREYERIRAEAATTREALKRELMASLGTPAGKKK